MLTDEEAEVIRKGLAEGWRGPVLSKRLEQLLQDRDERRQREHEREENDQPGRTTGRPWASSRPAVRPVRSRRS